MLDRRRFLTLLVAAGGALTVPLRAARAAAPGLTGDFEQGGMIVGRTEPEARPPRSRSSFPAARRRPKRSPSPSANTRSSASTACPATR